MKFTQKLLGYLHKVFDKDPHEFLAMRLQYQGGMTWQVSDGFLYTTVTSGSGQNLTIDLSQYTLAQLVAFIYTQPGYSVLYADTSILSTLKALVLMDGSGDISLSNGDHLYGYTNVLWSYMDAQSNELEQAQTQIGNMLQQMSTVTANDEWLDLLGAYYGVPRLQGEIDASYGPRIIAEVLRPRGNNVAIEMAIATFTGQVATVSDVTLYGPTLPLYNGAITRNSTHQYNAANLPIYGLFDVQYGYDLINGGDVSAFTQTVKDLVNKLRDAGTQMRSLSLTGSALTDALTPPSDLPIKFGAGAAFTDTLNAPTDSFGGSAVISPFGDTLTAPSDSDVSIVRSASVYNAVRSRNSAIAYAGGMCTITPAPAIDWNFMSGALDPSLTFARASTGTYFDAQGVMQTAAAGVPRFDHDPLTTKGLGLLMEESRTNGLKYSQAFDNASWVNTGATVTAGAVTAPDGTLTGAHIGDTSTASASKNITQGAIAGIASTSPSAHSVFGKAAEYPYLLMRSIASNTGGADYIYALFNLTTGTVSATGNVGLGSGVTAQIVSLPGGWCRCELIGTPSSNVAATNVQCLVAAQPTNSNGNVRTGTVGSGCYVWGAQLEAGAFPTSYIPTTSATVTRAQDVLSGTTAWLGSAGTLVLDYQDVSAGGSQNATLFVLTDGTVNNRIGVYKDSTGTQRLVRDSASNTNNVYASETNSYAAGRHRIAVAFGTNYNYARDGSLMYSASSIPVPSGLNLLTIAGDQGAGFPLTGWIRRFTYVASELGSSLLPLLST